MVICNQIFYLILIKIYIKKRDKNGGYVQSIPKYYYHFLKHYAKKLYIYYVLNLKLNIRHF